jgi:protocatechuate 3,4-dioxygenase beta subunit
MEHDLASTASLDGRSDRRGFLRMGGAALMGLAVIACSDDSQSDATTPATAVPATDPAAATVPATDPGTVVTVADSSVTTDAASTSGASTDATQPLDAAAFDGLGTCSLMPEKTAGPFPLDQQFDRRDVTEGYPGHPMRLGLRVVDADCAAVPGARVEIWHCDASGDYSAFADGGGGKDEAAGTTFLRGTQTADDNGIVEFQTIVPGWYRGRAVHIHLRVHMDDAIVLTSQLFFEADYLETVYTESAYAEFGLPDTSNESDRIAGNAQAEGTIVHTTPGETSLGTGTLALLNLGITT